MLRMKKFKLSNASESEINSFLASVDVVDIQCGSTWLIVIYVPKDQKDQPVRNVIAGPDGKVGYYCRNAQYGRGVCDE